MEDKKLRMTITQEAILDLNPESYEGIADTPEEAAAFEKRSAEATPDEFFLMCLDDSDITVDVEVIDPIHTYTMFVGDLAVFLEERHGLLIAEVISHAGEMAIKQAYNAYLAGNMDIPKASNLLAEQVS